MYKFSIFKGHPLNLNNCTGEETAEMKYIKGNLGRVDMINECEYDLFVRPDTCNPRHRVWFYFAVENALPNQVRFSLHLCNILSNFANFFAKLMSYVCVYVFVYLCL